jgi:DNA (cytosine-5)-methyltransferase 1
METINARPKIKRENGWPSYKRPFGRTTITVMSHIYKDSHYYLHSDPLSCRAWSVCNAARLQPFPEYYPFQGGEIAAYHQVGNAVPPRLAWQFTDVVAEHKKAILKL